MNSSFGKLFPLGDPPNYEPSREESVLALAERAGVSPDEMLYDLMLQREGRELLLFPLLNYSDFNCDAIYEMLHHPRAALGLGDGGAHCGIIFDASIPTFMLSHWVRDRTRGKRISVEFAVKRMTRDTAELYGLLDRGVLLPGMKGDLNVIDFDALDLELPELTHDLPAGAGRLIQRARGYVATVVSGEVTAGIRRPALRETALFRADRSDSRGGVRSDDAGASGHPASGAGPIQGEELWPGGVTGRAGPRECPSRCRLRRRPRSAP